MRVGLRTGALCVFVFLGLSAQSAVGGVIDFEGIADSTTLGSQISGLHFGNAAVIDEFGSLNFVEFPPHSGIAVATDVGGPMSITFTAPVLSVAGFFTYATQLSVKAFDLASQLVASTTSAFQNNELLSGDPGSSPNEMLSVSAKSISRVTITGDPSGGSFVLDDLTFSPSTTSVVPEPSTGSLASALMAALLVAGSIRRYRRIMQRVI